MDDWIGKTGVENAFEKYLRGTNGTRVISTNSSGKITSENYLKKPQPGNTVELSIDLNLQKAAESALADTVSRMTAEDGITRGAGVSVIEVGTGDILALASYPHLQSGDLQQGLQDAGSKRCKAHVQPRHAGHLSSRLHLQTLHRDGRAGKRRADHLLQL
jgi:penicillin-binding protein 2